MIAEELAKEGMECNYQEYVRFRNYLFDRYKADDRFRLTDWTVE
ncbi:hypothetical protein [Desulfosporosinus sp.]|nr:hypothetical protein [Desulfosporosinus sp.]